MQTQAVIEHIVHWLKDYATKAHAKGFVIGISGGIDSAVVSILAAKTGLNTMLIELPIRQHPDQVTRAQTHMQQLAGRFDNVNNLRVDLTPTFNQFVSDNPVDATEFANLDLALANARSRLRMVTLYYYGQLHGLLVAGTGNKIEDFGVGFFTKYGDGGVDLSPIADLTKTQVYELAKALGVDESIQTAVPTDGLWDEERTDEAQMGATYPELEWAMSVHADYSAADFTGRQQEVFQIYDRLHRAMQHKINPIPVCVIPENLYL